MLVFLIVAALVSNLTGARARRGGRRRDTEKLERRLSTPSAARSPPPSASRTCCRSRGSADRRAPARGRSAPSARGRAAAPPREPSGGVELSLPAELAAAAWVRQYDEAAGPGTDTLPGGEWLFEPLDTARGVVGVVAVRVRDGTDRSLPLERRQLLQAMALPGGDRDRADPHRRRPRGEGQDRSGHGGDRGRARRPRSRRRRHARERGRLRDPRGRPRRGARAPASTTSRACIPTTSASARRSREFERNPEREDIACRDRPLPAGARSPLRAAPDALPDARGQAGRPHSRPSRRRPTSAIREAGASTSVATLVARARHADHVARAWRDRPAPAVRRPAGSGATRAPERRARRRRAPAGLAPALLRSRPQPHHRDRGRPQRDRRRGGAERGWSASSRSRRGRRMCRSRRRPRSWARCSATRRSSVGALQSDGQCAPLYAAGRQGEPPRGAERRLHSACRWATPARGFRPTSRERGLRALRPVGTGGGCWRRRARPRHRARHRQAHGGRIRLESAPGQGTLFTLELPRR